MNEKLIQSLIDLLNEHGLGLLEETDQLAHLLEQKCGEFRKDNFLVTCALREAQSLGIALAPGGLSEEIKKLWAERLVADFGFAQSAAEDAVGMLASVLARLKDEETGSEVRRGNLPPLLESSASVPNNVLSTTHAKLVRRRALHGALTLAVILSILALIGWHLRDEQHPIGNEYRLACLVPMTGAEALVGQTALKAAQLAIDQINAAGGVKGFKVRLAVYDTRSDPQAAVAAAKKLLSDRRIVVLIGACSDVCNAAIAPLANELEVPHIAVFSGSNAVLLDEHFNPRPYTFSTCLTNAAQGKLMAYFASEGLGHKRYAILYNLESPYSQEAHQAFVETARALGGQVVVDIGYMPSDLSGIKPALTAVLASKAEVFVLPNRDPALPVIIKWARQMGWKGPILGGDGYRDALWDVAGSAMENSWWIVQAAAGDPALQKFLKAYEEKYNEPVARDLVSPAVLTYDTVCWVANALERANGFRGDDLRHALRVTQNLPLTHATLTIDPHSHTSLRKAAALIYCTQGKGVFQRRIWPH